MISDDLRSELRRRVRRHLELVYPSAPLDELVTDVLDAVGMDQSDGLDHSGPRWNQHDVAVITYADSITEPGRVPLQTLSETLDDLTGDVVTVVHVLPFYPSSSDGGFAVSDHRAVDPRVGTWEDISAIAANHTVMADLVVNHVSADHAWMAQFCEGEEPGKHFLRTADPEDDLSTVVRPRTTPLLREVETADGPRLLWCTFSHDQIDLDFENPDVLLDFLRTVDRLVRAGVSWFRLDAVAYLWKVPGTSCIHLPETHEIVKLLRTLLDARCPSAVIITETNVPHAQNVAYWGDGDEAHLVYNFSLPPLVSHTMLSGSATAITQWLAGLETGPPGTGFFNFIASHDGIGLRPVEGLLNDDELARLVERAHRAGGTHSEFDTPTGPRAYELNVSLWDLLTGGDDPYGPSRFLAAHTIMFSLAGVPALYVHALLGTPSYWAPITGPPRIVTEHGLPPVEQNRRTINRRKLTMDEAVDLLGAQGGIRRQVLTELVRRLLVRGDQPAFHPDSPQAPLELGSQLFGVVRGSPDWGQTVATVTNVSDTEVTLGVAELVGAAPAELGLESLLAEGWVNALERGADHDWTGSTEPTVVLERHQTVWLCTPSDRREHFSGR